MGGCKQPGPVCATRSDPIDSGTLSRQSSQPPGPVGSQPATTLPHSSGQWDEFRSKSVHKALYEALKRNPYLSQVEVVDILYSALSDGTVTSGELADLQMVAAKSRSIMPRSKTMLEKFVKGVKAAIDKTESDPYQLATQRHIYAAEAVCFFLKRMGNGKWPKLDRDEYGVSLLVRLAYPSLLDQGEASLCGPAAFLFDLVQDSPSEYVRYAIALYEKGTAKLGTLSITPGEGLLKSLIREVPRQKMQDYSPPIDSVDWLTMSSLRDSENWFLDYDTADRELAGATLPGEVASWFTKAGYSDVKQDANLTQRQRDTNNMDAASRLYSAGYRVCLFIDAQLLEGNSGDGAGDISQETEGGKSGGSVESGSPFGTDRHWVVLRSKIERSGDGFVSTTVYSYGKGDNKVPPRGRILVSDFLANYYGYVAAKP